MVTGALIVATVVGTATVIFLILNYVHNVYGGKQK